MAKGANNYYNKIAKIYDLMYTRENGYDHKAQVVWVDKYAHKLKLPKKMLDLACGTGIHLQYFKGLGYNCQGIDASKGMLKVAKKRLKGVQLKQGFFEDFKLKQPVPIITSFFNAMSYNKSTIQLKDTFKNVQSNLTKGGIFVFDVFCIDKPKPFFGIKKFENGKIKMSRTIAAHPTKKGFVSTMYYIVYNGKKSEIISETSIRGAFSKKQVIHCLKDAGFKIIYTGSGYAPDYNVFVAKK